jgi:hypothetical protein
VLVARPEIALVPVVVVQDDREVVDRLDGRHDVGDAALGIAGVRLLGAVDAVDQQRELLDRRDAEAGERRLAVVRVDDVVPAVHDAEHQARRRPKA